ncbi:hypothetical protein BS50DRAFT_626464 [Corynespora cassiicola Philippines]|uniref:Uncharacterized protein n=1 Tax=Corynespora cassiicola Philippines TaxID=1448308 RepID=A0A2T2N3B0_CORCC|nr:hypothetical protein BS50DRAFT_626464 [Corynespora cassiicola Philippines]
MVQVAHLIAVAAFGFTVSAAVTPQPVSDVFVEEANGRVGKRDPQVKFVFKRDPQVKFVFKRDPDAADDGVDAVHEEQQPQPIADAVEADGRVGKRDPQVKFVFKRDPQVKFVFKRDPDAADDGVDAVHEEQQPQPIADAVEADGRVGKRNPQVKFVF